MFEPILVQLGIIDQVKINDDKIAITINKKSGEFVGGCNNFHRMSGYTHEEFENRSPYDYIHPEDIETVLESHLHTSTSVPLVYWRLRTKSGKWLWFKTRSTMIGDIIVTCSELLN